MRGGTGQAGTWVWVNFAHLVGNITHHLDFRTRLTCKSQAYEGDKKTKEKEKGLDIVYTACLFGCLI